MPAFADYLIFANDHAPHERVGICRSQPVLGKLQAAAHKVFVIHKTKIRRNPIVMHTINIREIRQEDNHDVARVIRSVLEEHNVPKTGTAYADPELDHMFEAYGKPRHAYFVVEYDGDIVGGAGIAPLIDGGHEVCELQKMYFLLQVRGKGFGSLMMEKCLEVARAFEFSTCYLETMEYMEAAQKLYRKSGFGYLDAPMGNTGHCACGVWMTKPL